MSATSHISAKNLEATCFLVALFAVNRVACDSSRDGATDDLISPWCRSTHSKSTGHHENGAATGPNERRS